MLTKIGDDWIDPKTITAVLPLEVSEPSRYQPREIPHRVAVHHGHGTISIVECGSRAEAIELAGRIAGQVADDARRTKWEQP